MKVRSISLALVLGLLGPAAAARSQELPGVEAYAAAIAAMTTPRWAGPRVPHPMERDRPEAESTWRAIDAPLAIHAARGVEPTQMDHAMRGFRRMRSALALRGFVAPPPDGDLGGGPELDLYLVDDLGNSQVPHRADSDGPTSWTYLDGVVVHARVDGHLPPLRLEACAAEAYAEALLLALDPADAPAFRQATATFLGFLEYGRFDSCTDDVAEIQRAPYRGAVTQVRPLDGGGALFLALLAARHDGGSADFVRDTWTMARQRTWEGEDLRASPDLWEAIHTGAELVDDSLDGYVMDIAAARVPLGREGMRRSALPSLSGLPSDHAVAVAWRGRFDALPMRTSVHEPTLEALGSAYAQIDVRGAERGDRLRVYLRGEGGVRWALAALSFDATGREVARVEAGVRDREPNAYLPVELDGRASEVFVVVTNLGGLRPDADVPDHDDRTFHLIVDRATDG